MLNHIWVTAIIILYSLSNGFAAGNSGQTEQDGYEIYGTVYEPAADSWWEEYFAKLEAAGSEKEFNEVFHKLDIPKLPSAGVMVKLRGTSGGAEICIETTADSEGKYEFAGLKAGQYTVSCEKTITVTRTGRERTAFATGRRPVRFGDGFADLRRWDVPLHLEDDYVTVTGRVTDAGGNPLGGVTVGGVSWPLENGGIGETQEHTESLKPQRIIAVSNSDGYYELKGFHPGNLVALTRYMANGSPGLELGHKFFVEITAIDGGAVQSGNEPLRVPLVTEDLLYRARRIFNAFAKANAKTGGKEIREMEKLPYPLPPSEGNVIKGIDLLLERKPADE